MANIIVGKFGKSVSFNFNKWGMIGGDSESAIFIASLAQLYPQDNFYIVSKSDFFSLDEDIKKQINKNNNLFYCWEDIPHSKAKLRIDEEDENIVKQKWLEGNQNWIIKYFEDNNIKIDFGLIYSGLAGPNTLVNMYKKKDGSFYKPIAFSRDLSGPIVHFLNKTKTPYFEIGEDSRYFPIVAKDLFNRAKRILSVQAVMKSSSHIKSYEDQTIVETKTIVSNIEHSCMFLMNEDKNKLCTEPGNRTIPLNVAMHCTPSQDKTVDKYKIVREYIFYQFPEAIIYGDWKLKNIHKKYHSRIQKIPMTELHETMYNTKYTLMISGSKGWPTASKFWKMLIYGILPFFHEDSNHFMIGKIKSGKAFNVDDFLLVDSPEDFKNKIEILEKDLDLYNKLWYNTQSLIKDPELWSGDKFFKGLEYWVYQDFGHDMKREGKITYRNSSMFKKETNE